VSGRARLRRPVTRVRTGRGAACDGWHRSWLSGRNGDRLDEIPRTAAEDVAQRGEGGQAEPLRGPITSRWTCSRDSVSPGQRLTVTESRTATR
jgi:hypothetical protein